MAQRFLAADVVDVAEMREILNDIVADDKRAADVIRRLRLLLKKGDLEYVSLDLNEVVTRGGAAGPERRGHPQRRDAPRDWPPTCRACAATASSCSRSC